MYRSISTEPGLVPRRQRRCCRCRPIRLLATGETSYPRLGNTRPQLRAIAEAGQRGLTKVINGVTAAPSNDFNANASFWVRAAASVNNAAIHNGTNESGLAVVAIGRWPLAPMED